ncbi:MAG: hypothetical protein HWE22_05100 [Flavobacteriales bacterium]|nr:hypothetical protein [Flavobacteriales bacterium]
MRIIVPITIFLLTFRSIAQTDNFEASITHGNWLVEFINFELTDSIKYQKGDTVIFNKVPKRLKFKKQRPFRFYSDGSVHSPQTPPLSCGNVTTWEAISNLKWRTYSTWKIIGNEEQILLHFNALQLSLIQMEEKQLTFVVSD